MTGPDRGELTEKLRVALRIIGDYGLVLERHADGGVLMPESQLPAGRDVLKACILLVAAWRVSNGAPREELLPRARISYATLAHFVPDGIAERESAFNAAVERALVGLDANAPPPGELAGGAPVDEMERARAAFRALEAEFDAEMSRILP